jgi:CDP-diglyceride synthetase
MSQHTQRNFALDFVLGGLIIALSSYFIRISKSKVAGFIYGALPIGFVYLYLLTYYENGLSACSSLAREVIIATAFFLLFVFVAQLMTPFGPWVSILTATALFAIACYVYYYML